MSRRLDNTGKSLKGFTTASAGSAEDFLNSPNGLSISVSSGTMENITLIGSTIDASPIGTDIPDVGSFTSLTVGRSGSGGAFTVFGNRKADYMTYNPILSMLNLNGGMTVRDGAELGNIIIRGNYIEAIRPVPNGNINMLPQPQGHVDFQGNVTQTEPGYIRLLSATDFQATSATTANVDAGTSARLSSRNADVTIKTDYGVSTNLQVASIVQFEDLDNPVTNGLLFKTTTPHTFAEGDIIDVTGTNSTPKGDGRFTIIRVLGTNEFVVQISTPLLTPGTAAGTITKPLLGTVYISAGQAVQLDKAIPVRFGASNRAQIVSPANVNALQLNTDYLTFDDPLPQLRIPSGGFSDAGLQLAYTKNGLPKVGFFGFQSTTDVFTWIPDATITRNENGSKVVTGTKGIMSIEGLVLNKLTGDPDLLLEAKRNIILQAGAGILTPNGIPIRLGTNATLTPQANGNVQLASTGDFQIMPTAPNKGLVMQGNAPIYLNGSGGSQRIQGGPMGVTVASGNSIFLNTLPGGNVKLTESTYLQFGDDPFRRIYSDATGLNLESSTNINLRPASGGRITVPVNVKMQFGDGNDTISGAGSGQGLTVQSSGQLSLNSLGNTVISPAGGTLQSTAPNFLLPATSQVQFGPNGTTGIMASPGLLTIASGDSAGRIEMSAPASMTFNSPLLNVPLETRLTFGNRGAIWQTAAGTGLNISTAASDPLTITAPLTTVSGDLHVLGTVTYIKSTTTTFRDPILHLSKNPPPNDPTDKGFQFEYMDGSSPRMGALYWDTSAGEFVMGRIVTNDNEILTTQNLANLRAGAINAAGIVTGDFITNRITGTPDLFLVANGGSIFMQPTKSIIVPPDIPIVSGTNSITNSSTTGWQINSPTVNITQGQITLGNRDTLIGLTDPNNLHISNVPNTWIDSALYVQSVIRFGTEQVKINVDAGQNLVLTAPSGSNIILTSNALMNGGMTMGNALMQWQQDVPGGRIVWQNTSPTTPLFLSIMGAIYDAEWKGQSIGSSYGGTGHPGAWHLGSVVFVEATNADTYLHENNGQFFWDNSALALGIRTNTPTNALTVGSGHVDLAGNGSNIYWRHDGQYAFGLGKSPFLNLLTLKTSAQPSTSIDTLSSTFTVSPHGSVGLGQSDLFMSQLGGTAGEARLYLGGHLRFTNASDRLAWSDGEYILTTNDGTVAHYARTSVAFYASTYHAVDAQFYEASSRIWGTATGKLHLSSAWATYFRSPHNVFVGRCCYFHDPVTDACMSFADLDEATGDLAIVNSIGNITLRPLAEVHLDDHKALTFGDNQGRIVASGSGDLSVGSPTGNVILEPTTAVRIDNSKPLIFSSPANVNQPAHGTSFYQNPFTGQFQVTSDSQVQFAAPSLFIPDNSPLLFGHFSRQIVSDGQNLIVTGGTGEIRLNGNIVRIPGNLIVEGTTTQVFFTEASMESGTLQLGGGNLLNISGMVAWSPTSTQITTTALHGLLAGDTVTITNSNPDVDGTYPVTSVPTQSTFIVPFTMPAIDPGITIKGNVRSRHVTNPNLDVGIQVNWHTGTTDGTAGSRTGFFGFDRSTQRFTFYKDATLSGGQYTGTLGDAQFASLFVNSLSADKLVSPLFTGTHAVTGSNFIIGGGKIDGTPIGTISPNVGFFTNLSVDSITVTSTSPVLNLNADMVDGKHANELLWRDGSQSLVANWNAGPYTITSGNLASTALMQTQVVFAGPGGLLTGQNDFTFAAGILTVPQIGAFTMAGTITGNNQTITGANFTSGLITNSSMSLQQGNTLNVSQGTVTFATGQIPGPAVAGGTAAIDISGQSNTVKNGVYTTQFGPHTILKADTNATPTSLTVPENRIIGREPGGVITALTPERARAILNVAEKGADNIYAGGALMRAGSTSAFADAGKMTGAMQFSWERLVMQSNEDLPLDMHKQISYISVQQSGLGDEATVRLGPGIGDGHVKWIIVSVLPIGMSLRILFDYLAPKEAVKPLGLYAMNAGDSIMLVWDAVAQVWIGGNAGMFVRKPRGTFGP